MTPSQLNSYINYKLHITDADFPEKLDVANLVLNDICGAITKAKEDYFGVISHVNLTADRREYPLPDDILNNLKLVFLKLDGTNFKRARFLDMKDWKDIVYQEAEITNKFNNEKPAVGVFRNSLFVFSGTIKNVPQGIQLWYINFPPAIPNLTEATVDLAEATDPASTPKVGFPKQFHELLARGVIVNYKGTNEIPLTGREPLFNRDLEDKINLLKPKSLDEEFQASIPYMTGEDL